jgi:hypothetical protein
MTDISGNVEAMSGYTIGTGGTITDAEYTIFLGWAQTRVTEDRLTSSTDQATALMICHYISRKGGELGKVSETIGSYSYTRANMGESPWMTEYATLANRTVKGRTFVVKVN